MRRDDRIRWPSRTPHASSPRDCGRSVADRPPERKQPSPRSWRRDGAAGLHQERARRAPATGCSFWAIATAGSTASPPTLRRPLPMHESELEERRALLSFVRCGCVVGRRAGYRNALAERHSGGRASRPPSFVMKLQAAAWRAASTAPVSSSSRCAHSIGHCPPCGEEEGKRRQAARPWFSITAGISGRQPWRLLDTAASGSHGESAASATPRSLRSGYLIELLLPVRPARGSLSASRGPCGAAFGRE
jgi:hypothetical protein